MKIFNEIDCPKCPIETTLTMISNKWKVLIIRDLMGGTKRFGELKKSLNGISQKVLTENLRDMESKEIINRKVYMQIPPKVEYSLSEMGNSLSPVLNSMATWGLKYKQDKAEKLK